MDIFPKIKVITKPIRFNNPLRVPTLKQLATKWLPSKNEQIYNVYTVRRAINGKILLQTVPEQTEKHVYNETEGHEHQFSDFPRHL